MLMTRSLSLGVPGNPATSSISSQAFARSEWVPRTPRVRDDTPVLSSSPPDLQDDSEPLEGGGPAGLTMPAVLVAAFETPEGRRWLHRVLVGLVAIFVLSGGLGVSFLHEFLIFVGISRSVACSPRTLQRFALRLREQIVRWGRLTIAELASKMHEIPTVLVLDEHWHGGMHLVAYDALSGYLLLQSPSPTRSAAAWGTALEGALKGMRVRVLQTVGDDALGLSTCSIDGVKLLHTSDLFHPLYAITRSLGPPIALRVRAAERDVVSKQELVSRFDAAGMPGATRRRPRGTREQAVIAHAEAGKSLAEAKLVQDALRTQVRAAGAAAHPIDLTTGWWNTTHALRAALRAPGPCASSVAEIPDNRRANRARGSITSRARAAGIVPRGSWD